MSAMHPDAQHAQDRVEERPQEERPNLGQLTLVPVALKRGVEEQPMARPVSRTFSEEDEAAEMLRMISAIFFSELHDLLRREDIEDLIQEAFLRKAARAAAGDPIRKLAGWSRKFAVCKALNLLSEGDSRTTSLTGVDESKIILWDDAAPMLDENELAALHAAIARLPERQRLAITCHDLEGHSLRQTAQGLGLRNGNPRMASYHRARGLRALRNESAFRGLQEKFGKTGKSR